LKKSLEFRLKNHGYEHADTLLNIAELTKCLLLQGSIEDAEKLFEESLSQLPSDTTFYSARKSLARDLIAAGSELHKPFGAYNESRICYSLSLKIDPENPTVHNSLGFLLWVSLNEPKQAAHHFKEAIKFNPKRGVAHNNLAHLLAQVLDNPKEAGKHFKEAIHLDPNDQSVWGNYAALLLQLDTQKGDYTDSLKMARRAMRLCLPNPDRLMTRPLFCATAIMLLEEKDVSVPLGQLKMLFSRGIEHLSWIITTLLTTLDSTLPAKHVPLMHALSCAINDRERLPELDAYPLWNEIEPVPFDTAWPDIKEMVLENHI
jgi:tetratricopeptide (TPR) repeat protein